MNPQQPQIPQRQNYRMPQNYPPRFRENNGQNMSPYNGPVTSQFSQSQPSSPYRNPSLTYSNNIYSPPYRGISTPAHSNSYTSYNNGPVQNFNIPKSNSINYRPDLPPPPK